MTFLRLDHIITKRHTSGHVNADGIALVDGDATVTYGELLDRATLLARRLRTAGVRPGDRVMVHLTNRVEWIEAFFAIAVLRAVLVPASPLWVADELRHVADDSGASFALSEESLAARLEWPEQRFQRLLAVGQRPGWQELAGIEPAADLPEEPAEADEPFLLQYTSGTTGRPKAAIHTQTTVLLNALAVARDMAITRDDRTMILASLSWVAGLHALALPTLLVGGRIVLYPNEGIEVGALARAIERYKVTRTALVPLLIRKLITAPEVTPQQVASLRMILTGSEPVSAELIRELAAWLPTCDVVQAYGMTEFPSSAVILWPEHAIERAGSVGKAGMLTQLRIVDADGREAAPGEVGEVWIRAASTAKGYWNAPEATREQFVDGWFRTGDLGRLDEEGFLYIVGRNKDMIISGGLNIYPAEIERVLSLHPGVVEAAVVGRPDPKWGEVPVAFLVLRADVDVADVERHCRASLAKYKVPKDWIVRSAPLPRTATGKLRKFALRDELAQQA